MLTPAPEKGHISADPPAPFTPLLDGIESSLPAALFEGIELDPIYPQSTRKELKESGWLAGSGGRLTAGSVRNARFALTALECHFWQDEWAGVIRDGSDAQIHEKSLAPILRGEIEDRFYKAGYAPTAEAVTAAIIVTAYKHRRNPVTKQLRSKPWDGVDRLEHFGHIVFGTPDTDLHNQQAALLVRGTVVRALMPGCNFPYIPVLYSAKQGPAKGKALQIIAPGEMITGVTLTGFGWEKTLGERLAGVSIAEIPEVDALPPQEQRAAKKLATDVQLKFRPAYGREAELHPVPCIFVMTTNNRGMLSDTEHRRNPVIEIPKGKSVNLAWLQENIQQLWAQVVQEYDNEYYRIDETGTLTVELPPDLWAAAGENSRRHEVETEIRVWLEQHLATRASITSAQLRADVRSAKVKCTDQAFGQAMKSLGYDNTPQRINGKLARVWTRQDQQEGG